MDLRQDMIGARYRVPCTGNTGARPAISLGSSGKTACPRGVRRLHHRQRPRTGISTSEEQVLRAPAAQSSLLQPSRPGCYPPGRRRRRRIIPEHDHGRTNDTAPGWRRPGARRLSRGCTAPRRREGRSSRIARDGPARARPVPVIIAASTDHRAGRTLQRRWSTGRRCSIRPSGSRSPGSSRPSGRPLPTSTPGGRTSRSGGSAGEPARAHCPPPSGHPPRRHRHPARSALRPRSLRVPPGPVREVRVTPGRRARPEGALAGSRRTGVPPRSGGMTDTFCRIL